MQWILPPPSRISRAATPDHAAPREQPLQAPRRRLVGARIEQRHHDAAVGDVEIDVTCRQPFAGGARLGALARFQARGLLAPRTSAARASAAASPSGAGRGRRALRAAAPRHPGKSRTADRDGARSRSRHTSPGRTKQARLSTCPSVSSLNTPLPSQMTALTFRYTRSCARCPRVRARGCGWD